MLTGPEKKRTIAKIIKCRNDALDQIHDEMDRLSTRIDEIDNKVLGGGVLTGPEEKEKKGLLDGIDQLVAVETHVVLFSAGALDNAAEVKVLASQVDAANKELADVKQSIENLSKALKQAGDFLKTLTTLLTTVAGLLKVLA